jgi:PAS domain-containing protein
VAYEIFEDNKLDSANQRAARYEAQLMSSRVELERISKRNIELESRYTEFLNIADILPSSVVVISMEGKIIYANSAAILMMGNDLLECENIDNWLKRHLIVKNDEKFDEIIARWNSLVWSRGLTATFPVMTEKYGESVFEFKPRIMEQGGVVMSISDVSSSVASDSGSSKSELIKNQDLNTLILSELFSDYDEVNIESKSILESRIQALGLLGSFVEEKDDVQFVRFGDYCSELLKFLILLSPADSNPQIHMNYFSFSQSDLLKVNQKIDSSEILIPMLKSIYLALVINGIMKNIFQNVCDDNSNVIVGLSIFIDNRDSYGKVSITHDVQLDSSETFSDNFFGDQLKFIGSMIEKIDGSFELYSDLINEVSIEFKYR